MEIQTPRAHPYTGLRVCVAYPKTRALGPRRVGNPRLGFPLISCITMFKMPAYDLFSIVLIGTGMLLAAKLALSF
jgi:hypothetical protein